MKWREMDHTECDAKLGATSLGRLGFIDDAGRLTILPVNYFWDDGSALIRTGSGSKLAAAAQRREIAFEIDSDGDDVDQSWSVLVRGTLDLVADDLGNTALERAHIDDWIGADQPVVVKVTGDSVTGRIRT